MIYRYLPDVRIEWRDVWVGAAVTAFLFTIGKILIGIYLGTSGATSTYGAAGASVFTRRERNQQSDQRGFLPGDALTVAC